jgi:hypothetical protein
MEEAKLDEIQRRKFAMEAEQRALLEMLGDVEKNDQLILGLACRHLVHTQKRESELVVEENEQKSRLLQRAAQKKALEKIVKETAREIDRDDEKRQLLDIGERLAAQAHSSLR